MVSIRRWLRWDQGEGFQRARQPAARNCSITRVDQVGRRRRRIRVFVFKAHRLPFECAKLVKRLHLDPFDVLHGSDKSSEAVDVRRIIGKTRHKGESHPNGLSDRGKPFGKSQRGREVPTGHGAVGLWIGALDVEQDEIESGEVPVVDAIAEKTRRLDRRMQAHLFGTGQDPACEGELHHRLAARDGQAAVKRSQRRGKRVQPIDHLLGGDVGSVLQMPGIGIVAIGAP